MHCCSSKTKEDNWQRKISLQRILYGLHWEPIIRSYTGIRWTTQRGCWSATTAVIRHQELHMHKVDDTAWLLVRHYRRNPSSGVTHAQGGRHSVVVGPPLPP